MDNYKEFPGKKPYATWSDTTAVADIMQSMITNAKLDTKAQQAAQAILDYAPNMEIELRPSLIQIKESKQRNEEGYPYSCMMFCGIGSMTLMASPDMMADADIETAFASWLEAYMTEKGVGKWINKDSVAEMPEVKKQISDNEKKFKRAFNKCLKGDYRDRWIDFSRDMDKIYATIKDLEIELMIECIKAKIKKTPYEELLTNAYKLFYYSDKRLSLKKTEHLLAELKESRTPTVKSLFENQDFEVWEKEDKAGFKKLAMNPDNAADVVKTLKYIVDNSDSYFKLRRFDSMFSNLEIHNKSDIVYEDAIFGHALRYKECESLLAEYVHKQTEYNKKYPIHYVYGFSVLQNQPVGHIAAASLAILNSTKYDSDIAAFLQSLEECDWFERMCKDMRGHLKRNKMIGDLPVTFAKYPEVKPVFE